MVLLEAAANAIPSVSFDVQTGPREIIDDGVNGYLAPCYDCEAFAERLGALMDDPSLRQRFSDAMTVTQDKFSEERIYLQWRALVADLCGGE